MYHYSSSESMTTPPLFTMDWKQTSADPQLCLGWRYLERDDGRLLGNR